jgi:hypothetical protein
MSPRTKAVLVVTVSAVTLYGAWAAYRAHQNLVTLDVRNMEVRQVVKKIEWQTWETILVHSNVQGKITLQVRKMPLEEVLRILGEQTSSGWGTIYPLYSTRRSLAVLKQALRGETDPASHGWTNLQGRFFFRGGPRMGGANANPQGLLSLHFEDKDITFATLALDRFAQARVVPEDGTTARVSLNLSQATVPRAVAQLAGKAHRSWTKLYTLRGQFGPGGPGGPGGFGGPPPQLAMRDRASGDQRGGPGRPPALAGSDTNSTNQPGPRGPAMTPEQWEEMRKQRERLEAELAAALPAAERQKLDAERQQRELQMQELQNLTPEQRQQRFAQMGGQGMDQRNRDRVRNSTPEQRVEQQRRMLQMRQRMQSAPPSQPPPR